MPIKYRNAGFISATYQPLQVANAPTIGTASGGDTQASVAFTVPGNVGGSAVTAYYAVSNPGQITASAASSPITVTGLSNGTAYTFTVWALNSYGPSPYSGASNSVSPSAPVAFFAGGYVSGNRQNVIDYVNISTTGNATDWGDLSSTTDNLTSTSSATRGLFAGNGLGNRIDYITFSSQGDAADFGDMPTNISSRDQGPSGNSTRGLLFQDYYSSPIIQYVTIATTGNSTNFGNLTVDRYRLASFSSPTRTVMCGGEGSTYYNIIDYVTTATTGNATDFGDCIESTQVGAVGGGSATRGLIIGGRNYDLSYPDYLLNSISYITIASTGNATDFGDLYNGVLIGAGGSSSSTRMLVGGGESLFVSYNVIQYITIASTGNSTDFGDLTQTRYNLGSVSNAHGGLQ